MARTKTTEMSTITAAQLADGDLIPVIDVSDTTMSSTGTNKKLAKSQLAEAAGVTAHLADTSDAHDASAISFSATGNIVATDVQAAIAELDSEKAAVAEPIAAAHIADTSAAHAASAVSFSATGSISSTDVQAAIAEVDSDLTAHTGDTSDAHDASAISVLDTAGNYTATDVEAVLAELPSRFVSTVVHGAVGSTPRPALSDARPVTWYGTATPANAVAGDLWVDGNEFAVLSGAQWMGITSLPKLVPTTVTGLVAWWRADRITGLVNADPVTTWADASGNGNNLTGSGTTRPTLRTNVMNGRSALRFDGSDDVLTRTFPASLTQPTTIISVSRCATPKLSFLYDGGSAGNRNGILYDSSPFNRGIFAGTVLTSTSPVTTGIEITTGVYNGASSRLRVNGTQIASGNAGTNPLATIRVGSESAGTYFFDGDIAEMLIYSSALSTTDISYIERALGAYYGVAIA